MATLEVFFDYACPFCMRGHEILLELAPQYPAITIEWRPCEAHPRPDSYGSHSDLCARGMFYVQEHGTDLMDYHRRMYRAALIDGADIEGLSVVAKLADGLPGSKLLYEALAGGAYLDKLLENNRLAWEAYQFPAVPSYRMNGKLLKSEENIGVTKRRLVEFLDENSEK